MRNWLLGGLVLGLLTAAGLYQASRARCFQLVGEVTCRIKTNEKIVALSFDDGPAPEGVAAVIRILQQHDVKATFFLIGERIERFPGQAESLLAAGHELGNHSYSHQRNLLKPQSFYRSEVRRTGALLDKAGSDTTLFRPPFGKRLIGLPLEVEGAGYQTIMWDVEDRPEDFDGDPRAYANDIVTRVQPGSIILMHPMYRHNRTAREALPMVLQGLKKRGFEVITVSELLRRETR